MKEVPSQSNIMFVRIPERSNLSKGEVEHHSITNKETFYFDEARRLIWVAGIPYGREYDPELELYVDEELEGFVDENFDPKAFYEDDPTKPASIMSDSSSFFS